MKTQVVIRQNKISRLMPIETREREDGVEPAEHTAMMDRNKLTCM